MTKVHSDEGPRPDSGHSGSSKRRKTSADHDGVDNLSDLSGDTLAAIAAYLPKTSRALLAVALTAPPSAWRERGWTGMPSDAGRAILSASASSSGPFSSVLEMNLAELKGSDRFKHWAEGAAKENGRQKIRLEEYYGASIDGGGWAVLDFLDLDTGLASKLTDDDIGAMLACIDAQHNLKKLYLTKCSSFVGDGLGPLRGSSVLEQIDFKILHLETSTYWGSKPKEEASFSLEKAFSILGSILSGEASSLRRMEVPRNWIVPGHKGNQEFMKFLSGHKHALNVSTETGYFGFGESKEEFVSNYIQQQQDSPMERCGCGRSSWTKCVDCDIIMCGDEMCRIEGDDARICDHCDKTSCLQCIDDGDPSVSYCDSTCAPYCDDCRYISCRGGGNECECCRGIMFDRLLQESAVQAAEIERLRNENIDLLRMAMAQENGDN